MKFAGIDGCSKGWVVTHDLEGKPKTEVHETLRDFLDGMYEQIQILIDIPIGLGDRDVKRDVDHKARKYLDTKFKSSVFTPPVREAVYEKEYEEASKINKEITGNKLSVQSWNLVKKIREVDKLLYPSPASNLNFHEAHPESIFKFLNGDTSLKHKKKASEGQKERIAILDRKWKNLTSYLEETYATCLNSGCKKDDILDSLALYHVAYAGMGVYKAFQGLEEYDSRGILMRICYGY